MTITYVRLQRENTHTLTHKHAHKNIRAGQDDGKHPHHGILIIDELQEQNTMPR